MIANPPLLSRYPAAILLIILLGSAAIFIPSPCDPAEKISLKKYPHQGFPVPNPVDLTRLPKGKTFQITHKDFILQFFFNEQDIFGIIFKRNIKRPIHIRWCFFRNCEENPLDYKVVIAEPYQPPMEQNFFSVTFPPQLPYSFQGLEFTSGR